MWPPCPCVLGRGEGTTKIIINDLYDDDDTDNDVGTVTTSVTTTEHTGCVPS